MQKFRDMNTGSLHHEKEEVLDQMQTELARNRGKEERSDEMDEGTAERH